VHWQRASWSRVSCLEVRVGGVASVPQEGDLACCNPEVCAGKVCSMGWYALLR